MAQIKEERDSLQLATRLIAQDKLCQRQDTTSNILNSNSVSCQYGKRKSNTAQWQNIRKENNKANRLSQAQPTRLDMPNRFACLNEEAEHNEVVEIEQPTNCPHSLTQLEKESVQLPSSAEQKVHQSFRATITSLAIQVHPKSSALIRLQHTTTKTLILVTKIQGRVWC